MLENLLRLGYNEPKRLQSLATLINDVDSLMYGQKLLTEIRKDDGIIKAASQESILSELRVNTECEEIDVIDDSDNDNKKDELQESEKKSNRIRRFSE